MAYHLDILIYNNSLYEHREYVKIILEYVRNARLFLDMIKYEFHISKVLYLGFIINTHCVKMDPAKLKKF